jgi:UDPglucose 6-dehydrogenase
MDQSKKLKKIGVMGLGMVGGSVAHYFQEQGHVMGTTLFGYDPGKGQNDIDLLNAEAEVVFVAVPTPYNVDPKSGIVGHDLSYVQDAFKKLTGSKTVVIKSTVLPGTTDDMARAFPAHRVLFNPEFLTEVTADNDMRHPDRQIVGFTTHDSFRVSKDVMALLPLAPFERIMTAKDAEMVKYYGNTWFSTKVVFANQMYDLCQKLDVDYEIVKEAASADKRIGPTHLEIYHKGYRGYGGKCLPKDTRALIQLGRQLGVPMELLETVENINNRLVASGEVKQCP